MNIRNESHATGSRYVAALPEGTAEMSFSRASPHLVIMDHTFMAVNHPEGRGIGQKQV